MPWILSFSIDYYFAKVLVELVRSIYVCMECIIVNYSQCNSYQIDKVIGWWSICIENKIEITLQTSCMHMEWYICTVWTQLWRYSDKHVRDNGLSYYLSQFQPGIGDKQSCWVRLVGTQLGSWGGGGPQLLLSARIRFWALRGEKRTFLSSHIFGALILYPLRFILSPIATVSLLFVINEMSLFTNKMRMNY